MSFVRSSRLASMNAFLLRVLRCGDLLGVACCFCCREGDAAGAAGVGAAF